MELELNVLGINCAYTKTGPVAQMLDESIQACMDWADNADVAASFEALHLSEVMQGFTTPKQGCIPKYLKETAGKLLKADVVLFATPVFWGMPSPLFSQFLIDITPYEFDGDFPLRGKVAGVITHCDEDGGEKVVSDVLSPLRHFGFALPPHAGFWRNRTGAIHSEGKWQVDDHQKVLANNLVQLAVALKKAAPEWQ